MATQLTDDVELLIQNYELELGCSHCAKVNVRRLGWVRSHKETSCDGCDSLIILDTSSLRELIRETSRQLRALRTSLQTDVRCWQRESSPPTPRLDALRATPSSRASREGRVGSVRHLLQDVEALLDLTTSGVGAAEQRSLVASATDMHATLKALCLSICCDTDVSALDPAFSSLEFRLASARRAAGLGPEGAARG